MAIDNITEKERAGEAGRQTDNGQREKSIEDIPTHLKEILFIYTNKSYLQVHTDLLSSHWAK